MLIIRFFLLLVALTVTACSHKPLTLTPSLEPFQYVLEDSKLVSQQFHLVAVSPSFEIWDPNPVFHLGFAIKNGSAIETPMNIGNFSVTLNGKALPMQSYNQLHQRTLAEHDRLVERVQKRQEQERFGSETAFADGDGPSFGDEWDDMGMAMNKSLLQGRTDKGLKGIDVATKRKLERIDSLYRTGILIPANKTYESFVEAELPSDLKVGDELTVAINLAPDLHIFHMKFVEDSH